MQDDTPKALRALQVDERKLKERVDDTDALELGLNALLKAEADEICGARW